MSDNELVMQTLLDQNKMLGSISSQIASLDKKLDLHVVDDTKAHARIAKLEEAHNKMKGAAMAWSVAASAAVSAIGWYFGKGK